MVGLLTVFEKVWQEGRIRLMKTAEEIGHQEDLKIVSVLHIEKLDVTQKDTNTKGIVWVA